MCGRRVGYLWLLWLCVLCGCIFSGVLWCNWWRDSALLFRCGCCINNVRIGYFRDWLFFWVRGWGWGVWVVWGGRGRSGRSFLSSLGNLLTFKLEGELLSWVHRWAYVHVHKSVYIQILEWSSIVLLEFRWPIISLWLYLWKPRKNYSRWYAWLNFACFFVQNNLIVIWKSSHWATMVIQRCNTTVHYCTFVPWPPPPPQYLRWSPSVRPGCPWQHPSSSEKLLYRCVSSSEGYHNWDRTLV